MVHGFVGGSQRHKSKPRGALKLRAAERQTTTALVLRDLRWLVSGVPSMDGLEPGCNFGGLGLRAFVFDVGFRVYGLRRCSCKL